MGPLHPSTQRASQFARALMVAPYRFPWTIPAAPQAKAHKKYPKEQVTGIKIPVIDFPCALMYHLFMNRKPLPVAFSVGQRLKKARLSKNITQSELSLRIGVSERSLRNLQSGHPVRTDTLFGVLRELGYMEDLEVILDRSKPTTVDEHQAIMQVQHKLRRRARPA